MKRAFMLTQKAYVTVTETLSGSGNWNAPANMLRDSLYVEAEAPGGGGGNAGTLGGTGSGAGSGAYSAGFDTSVVPGQTNVPYNCGTPGTKGVNSGGDDATSATNATWNTSVIVAEGGKKGRGQNLSTAGGAGGLAANGTGTTKINGNTGANGAGGDTGGEGAAGVTSGSIVGGAQAARKSNGNPVGGGGSGGQGGNNTAGNGAAGQIKLTYKVIR